MKNYMKFGFLSPLVGLVSLYCITAKADVLQVNTAITNGHFVRGQNLTDGQPTVSLSADWSMDNGLFTGAECYKSNSARDRSLSTGCEYYLGYFKAFNNGQAITTTIKHNDYSTFKKDSWDYTQASVDWHLNRNATINLTATDDWLGRGFATVALDASLNRKITEKFSAQFSAGVMKIESSAPVDHIELAELSMQYEHERWLARLSTTFTDTDDLQRMTQLDVSQPEISFSIKYRLY